MTMPSDAESRGHGWLWFAIVVLAAMNVLSLHRDAARLEAIRVRVDSLDYVWDKVADSAYSTEGKLRQMQNDGTRERLEENVLDLRKRVSKLEGGGDDQ